MKTSHPGRHPLRRGVLAAAVTVVCWCVDASLAQEAAASKPSLANATTVERVEPSRAPQTVSEMLQVDDEMRAYFDARVTAGRQTSALRQIVNAIVDPKGLHFAYDAEATFDARETFRQRRGNCLSFSILVAAIARDYGFDALFQSLVLPAHWDRYGELIASLQHINVRVATDAGPMIVDLRPDLVPRADLFALKIISDEGVLGCVHSDKGFFLLVHGSTRDALQEMIRATEIDPDSATNWGNRATLLARLGELASARYCFERSLRLDSRGESALVGYVQVLQRLGTPEDLKLAKKFEARAQRLRDRNPYYHEYVARQAQDRGDWNTAEKSLRRAIWLKDDEPVFYVQWIATLQELGRTKDAARAATKLERLQARIAGRSEYVVR